ncbi:MAG: hypothetical protein ACYTG0_15350 [Planctomycetota bacterium]|jgi:hypothetical protein
MNRKETGWSIGDVAFRDLDTGRPTWLVTGSRGEHVISAKGRTQVEAWANACRLGGAAPCYSLQANDLG